MVAVASSKISSKSDDKIPASKHQDSVKSTTVKVPVSPTHSMEDEVIALRAKNKILTDAFKALKNATQDHSKRRHELVWYARNRCRYPNHKASKFLDHSEEHHEEIEKLRGDDGSFHHGFNSGVLAAARMFEAHADIIVHVDDDLVCHHEMHAKATEHSKHIIQKQRSFPDMNVDEAPTL